MKYNYDINVSNMYLYCFHPDNKDDKYIRYEVLDMEDSVDKIIKDRECMLSNK